MAGQFRLTVRRLDTLATVRSELVHRDLQEGCWLINQAPARRWHGRTLSELEQARLIQVDSREPRRPSVTLTPAGHEALAAIS